MTLRPALLTFALPALLVIGCAGSPRCKPSAQAGSARVAYCELITQAEKYDGRKVLTEATWTAGLHADSLIDMACREVNGRPASTTVSGPVNDSLERRALYSILEARRSAKVAVVGIFHVGRRGGDAGPTGQPYGLEVECILRVGAE